MQDSLGLSLGVLERSLFLSSPWFPGAAEREPAVGRSVASGPGVTAPKRRFQG